MIRKTNGNKTLGEFMRDWRKANHSSQIELAECMGVSDSTISKAETGVIVTHKAEFLEALSRCTGEPVMNLYRLQAPDAVHEFEAEAVTLVQGIQSAPSLRREFLTFIVIHPEIDDLESLYSAFVLHRRKTKKPKQ